MKTALANRASPSFKYWLYGISFLIAIAFAIGFVYLRTHPPKPAVSAPSFSQLDYYSQLVYAVNEMRSQVETYENLRQQGKVSLARVKEGQAYADSLMSPLTSPPEELSVAQYITEQLFQSYHQYLRNLETGSPQINGSLQLAKHNVNLFRQNAKLITLLNAYNGVNIYCH